MIVVFCAPKFDEATQYSYECAGRLREQISDRVTVIALFKADATRGDVEQALRENPSAIWIHYDHGETDAVLGQDAKPVIDLDNVDLLKARVAYNMNCLSAKTLGKAAYQVGCLAYWGYVEVVSFTTNALEEFYEAFNYGLILWLQGKTWSEALELTKQRMTELIDDLVKRGYMLAAMALREDRDCLVCYTVENPPQAEPCPLSRIIVALFGYKVLLKLRKTRDKLKR